MKSTHVVVVGSFIMAFSIASCAKKQPPAEMVTESMALEMAKTEFANTGRKIENYKITVEAETNGRWIVWFDEKGPYPTPGGKHAVTVEEATGKTVFLPGE